MGRQLGYSSVVARLVRLPSCRHHRHQAVLALHRALAHQVQSLVVAPTCTRMPTHAQRCTMQAPDTSQLGPEGTTYEVLTLLRRPDTRRWGPGSYRSAPAGWHSSQPGSPMSTHSVLRAFCYCQLAPLPAPESQGAEGGRPAAHPDAKAGGRLRRRDTFLFVPRHGCRCGQINIVDGPHAINKFR